MGGKAHNENFNQSLTVSLHLYMPACMHAYMRAYDIDNCEASQCDK